MEKKNRWYRSQLLVSASKLRDRQITLGLAIEWLSANSPRGLRWHIDVDPIDQI
jgi:primosomal protein N'